MSVIKSTERKPKSNNSESTEKKPEKRKTWQKVKIKGKVISDEAIGFEGLIGLEVLKDYNPKMVKIAQPKLTRKQKRMQRKKDLAKRKLAASADSGVSEGEEDSTEESDEDTNPKQQLTRKEKAINRLKQQLEKRKAKREQRKAKKMKQPMENSTNKTKNLAVASKRGDKDVKEVEELPNAEYPPDRFKYLKPLSPQSDDEEETAPELVAAETSGQGSLSIDDLEGWSGLGVPASILRAIAENGFKSPTEIQTLTLPAAILGKKDILGAAETGSGKTLAFGIPLLSGIMELKSKNLSTGIRKAGTAREVKVPTEKQHELTPPPNDIDSDATISDEEIEDSQAMNAKGPLYALVLTPTRELAVQVRNHLISAAKYTGIKVAAIFGGLSIAKQERLLRQCPEIIVATPGRFWELYQQGNPHLNKIDDISFLVIDETDRMVEKGHFEELRILLRLLNANDAKKQARQNFVFSATLTLVHDLPDHMQKRNLGKRQKFVKQTPGVKLQNIIEELGLSQPKVVDITCAQQTAQTLTECRLQCSLEQKDYYLYYFVQRHPGRTIVFCNSIDCVKRLATLFGLLDCHPLPLHANMIQKQRLKNLERFRDNPCGLLIATDVAARGLDIPHVEHVIHYQVPRTSENYVHRSGRTARANKDGITVILMEPAEVRNYVKLCKTLNRTEDLPLFPVSEKFLAAVKERVNLAREVDKQELKLRRNQSEIGWMKKQADEMDLIIDGFNDDLGSDTDEDPFIIEKRRDRMQLLNARTQLKQLLARPIFSKGFSFKYPTSSGQLEIPQLTATNNNESNSAVTIMKRAIVDLKEAKKMRNKKKKLS